MRILFFLEPLVKEDSLLRLSTTVWNHVGKLISTLSVQEHEFRVIANKCLESYVPNSEISLFQCYFLNDLEMLLPFEMDYLKALKAWYQGGYSSKQLEYMSDLIKGLLGEFVPDVIIGITSGAPYLSHAYPESVLLHYEAGIVSREPFPVTHSLDPFGMYANSGFVRVIKNIEAIQLDFIQQDKINQFKKFFISKLVQQHLIPEEDLRSQYRHLILVPLQEQNTVYFNVVSGYSSLLQFILNILSKVPKDVGVIFTTHSAYPYFTPELVSYLRSIAPNFLFFPELQNNPAASQYLMGSVDLVISVASSVGLQTLIWDKKLISIGCSHLNPISDSNELSDINEVLLRSARYKDQYLIWLLCYYGILDRYINDSVWFNSFLQKCHLLHLEGRIESLYDTPIDDIEKILNLYMQDSSTVTLNHNNNQYLLNEISKTTSSTYDGRIELSKAHINVGDFQTARIILFDAIAEKPYDSTAYIYLSKLFLDQGNLSEARFNARKAWRLALESEDFKLLTEIISNQYIQDFNETVNIFGGINTPFESQTISGLFLVQGWVLSDLPGMVDLEICLDNQVLDCNIVRVHRDDVRIAYPMMCSVNLLPGFRVYLDTLQYINGSHELTFSGIFRNVTKVMISHISVIIQNDKIDGG